MFPVPIPPTPMQPSVILLLAPKAEAGMMVGRLIAARAAAEPFRKSRRLIGVCMGVLLVEGSCML